MRPCDAIGVASEALSGRAGFSLVELLVVVSILSLILATLLPGLAASKVATRRTICLANLHGIGTAIHLYAANNRGCIPFGPKAPPMLTASDFYPSTGASTSLISLRNRKPVGLGLTLSRELMRTPQVLFCPGSEQPLDATTELAKVGRGQAQSSYYYRHASVTQRVDPPGAAVLSPDHIRLDRLGINRNRKPIRALVIDTQFAASSEFETFGIKPRTHHAGKTTNVLRADGHAESLSNRDHRFTVSLDTYEALQDAFGHILAALERAD